MSYGVILIQTTMYCYAFLYYNFIEIFYIHLQIHFYFIFVHAHTFKFRHMFVIAHFWRSEDSFGFVSHLGVYCSVQQAGWLLELLGFPSHYSSAGIRALYSLWLSVGLRCSCLEGKFLVPLSQHLPAQAELGAHPTDCTSELPLVCPP